jgi:Divergent InlB B-repeat domain
MRRPPVVFATVLLALLLVRAASAQHAYQVFLDTDNDPTTGCTALFSELDAGGHPWQAQHPGLEQQVSILTDGGSPPLVVGITHSVCSQGVFGPPESVSTGTWPVGVGAGVDGSSVVEGFAPRSLLGLTGQQGTPVNLHFQATRSGACDTLLTTDGSVGGFAIVLGLEDEASGIPALGPIGVTAVALLIGLSAFLALRRRLSPRATIPIAALVVLGVAALAWAATITMDGQVADWNGIAPIATDPAGDSSAHDPTEDIVAVFATADSTNLYFRFDVTHGVALTVSKTGDGTGTVTSQDPPGTIDCGATCAHLYDVGTKVTLDATPDTGWVFAGWSGACSGFGQCVVAMNAAASVEAAFVQCVGASDCPGTDTECRTRTCAAGACGMSFTAGGTPVSAQTAGDCQKNVCNGSGDVTSMADNTDIFDDGNPCTADVCTNGVSSNPFEAAGTSCGTNLVCDGSGSCVGCIAAADCGTDTACRTWSCTAGACGVSYTADGTLVANPIPGDCRKDVCDGAGNIVSVADDTEVPADDGNQCTTDICVSGVPSHPSSPQDTPCSQNGGTMCDGSGACVQCIKAWDCPGTDTECRTRTCAAGACGMSFTAGGTPCSTQVPGDCQKNVCDGAGNITSVADDTDVPADDGNQCTNETCVSGVPSHPASPAGTTCSQDGGETCDGYGKCILLKCSTASECPGSDTECRTRTCNGGACGFSFSPIGTPVSNQTAGDCQHNVCDGSGNITSVADDTDVPADDGNQCTNETCVSGVPSHPSSAPGTTCSQNGGVQCDGNGACVEITCLNPSDCPGIDTECGTRTCNAGSCGFVFAASGTPVASQTLGDCKVAVCDGSGNITSVADDTDVPADDGNQCTTEECASGVPSHPASPAGTSCSQNGGVTCDGNGACVQCLNASDCSGVDSECQTRTCNGGFCGMSFAAKGTPVSNQTPGDCLVNVCDGSGDITAAVDDADIPADDGNQCTNETCVSGVPSHPSSAPGTSCSQNGGLVCDGSGACVPVNCTTASECPGSDDACQSRTCTNGVCGVFYSPNGTSCDDGNPCTQTDTCQSGLCLGSNPVVCVPIDSCHTAGKCDVATGACSNPTAPNGTSCTDGNGCTQTDVCMGGTCVGSNPVICVALDSCHTAGTCDPVTGACTNPTAPDGTSCNDGDPCTQPDTCQSGTCTSTPLSCNNPPNAECWKPSGWCAGGDCIYTPVPAGMTCLGGSGTCDGAGTCVP